MIDYAKLADATHYYGEMGFKRIESPWTVTKAISDITRPPEAKDFSLIHDDNKVLVASGEQSFLYLYNKGFLPKGKFQTTTPCFRKESFGPFHTKYFIKTELIDTENVTEKSLMAMIDHATCFFGRYTPALEVVKTSDTSYDINVGGIEVGSYGIRTSSFLDWIYGTGVAEPRLTKAVDKFEKETYGRVP
jgi:hypothetical protein